MGAVFTLGFAAVIVFIALIISIICIIFIVIYNKRKRRGDSPKKRGFVIPLIILIINCIIILIPIVFIGFLQINNSDAVTGIERVDSSRVFYWPVDEDGHRVDNWFEMDGEKYWIERPSSIPSVTYSAKNAGWGEAIANITIEKEKGNPATLFYELMTFLGTGHGSEWAFTSTVYPVNNENGFDICHVTGGSGGGLFFSNKDNGAIFKYYQDLSNYDTQNITVNYYPLNISEGERIDSYGLETLKKTVSLDADIISQAIEIQGEHNYDTESVDIFTGEYEYDERIIVVHSKDKFASYRLYLLLYNGQVYVGDYAHLGYMDDGLLPPDINQYLIDNVFSN